MQKHTRKIISMRKLFTFISLIACVNLLAQHVYTVETVPDPKKIGGGYVSNPDGLLSPQVVPYIDTLCAQIEHDTEVQIAVVALGSVGDVPYDQFSVRLANYWGIGKAEKNTGILIFWVADQRKVRIDTGRGIEQYLTDADCGEILDYYIIPHFKKDEYSAGIYRGIEVIQEKLMQPEVRTELLTTYKKAEEPEWAGWVSWYITLMMLALIFLCYRSYRDMDRRIYESNDIAFRRADGLATTMVVFGVLFPPLLALWKWGKKKRDKIRRQPFDCDNCGHEMKLLSEDEEDKYLTANQIAEEKVKSMDYDVWVCPECSNLKVLAYDGEVNYEKCEKCGAKTVEETSDVTITHATEYHAGQGEKTYTCLNCGNVHKSYYVIPRIVRSSSSSSSRSSGGGGGSSWGGGSFGGGGAGRGY